MEDLLQDVLIKTHDNFNQIKSDESIKSWLYQVTNRTVIDFYRRCSRESELVQYDLWYDNTEANIKQELFHCIELFLKSLSVESSELLRAVYLNEQSQKEYAESVGISYSTLKAIVQKARSDLKAVFDGCCRLSLDKQGKLIGYERKAGTCFNC